MATIQEAKRRLTIESRTVGVKEAAAATRDLGAAVDGVAVASGRAERATQSMEGRLASIQRKYDAQYRAQQELARIERTLDAARTQGLVTEQRRIELMNMAASAMSRQSATARGLAAVNDNMNRMSGSMSGLAAQFQDIGVTAAMGMNPAIIALQQGTQIAGQMEVAMQAGGSALGVLANAFKSLFSPLTFVTITLTALAAAGLQMVDWVSVGQAALGGLASALEAVAPYAAAAAAALALLYAPAILGGLKALTLGILGAAKAAGTAAIAFAAANPATAFALGIMAAVAAANIFRDELAAIFGRDIVDDAKKVVNFVINAFRAAFADVVFVWNNLPTIMDAAARGAGNMLIAGIEGAINILIPRIKEFYRVLNPIAGLADLIGGGAGDVFGTGMMPNEVQFTRIANASAASLSGAANKHGAEIARIMSQDSLGDFGGAIARGASAAAAKLRELAASLGETEKAKKKARSEAEKLAEKYDDILRGAEAFIASQMAERAAVGLSEEAAARLRHGQDLLNRVMQAGIPIDAAKAAEIRRYAEAMADAEMATRHAKEAEQAWKDIAGIAANVFSQSFKSGADLLDRMIGQAGQLGAALQKAVGGQAGKLLGAGLGGFGAGYQSQNALMGAAGGALSGFMSGGPIGALIGGIGGLIGGIFGQAKKRAEEARKAAEQLAETERQNAASRLEIARAAYQRETQALRDLAAAHRAYADSIYKTIDAMRLNPAITALNPEQRVDEARRQFEAALKAGPNGDVSGTLQRYAEEALSYFGATETYFDLLARAQDQALAAAKASERTATTAERQLATMERQYGKLLGIETGVKSLASAVRDYEKAQKAAAKAIAAVNANNNAPKSIWQRIGDFFGFANGGAFQYGHQITPFANGGIVGRPTLFPMANGAGLMGEAGPEAIMPLRRGRDGKLGVAANSNSTNDNRALQNIASVSANGSNAIVDALVREIGALRSEIASMRQDQRMIAAEAQRGGRQRVA